MDYLLTCAQSNLEKNVIQTCFTSKANLHNKTFANFYLLVISIHLNINFISLNLIF